MPIDIRATLNGEVWTRAIWNNARTQHYVLPVSAPASVVTFDEEGWTLPTAVQNVAYVPGPLVIVDTVPSPRVRVSYGMNRLQVTFHTRVTVSASDFEVRGQLQGVQPFILHYNPDTCTAVLDFPQLLPTDAYVPRVKDTVRAEDTGLALDGEIHKVAFPSGDGQPSGDAVVYFSVTLPARPSPPPPIGRRPCR